MGGRPSGRHQTINLTSDLECAKPSRWISIPKKWALLCRISAKASWPALSLFFASRTGDILPAYYVADAALIGYPSKGDGLTTCLRAVARRSRSKAGVKYRDSKARIEGAVVTQRGMPLMDASTQTRLFNPIQAIAQAVRTGFRDYSIAFDDRLAVISLTRTGAIIGVINYDGDSEVELRQPAYAQQAVRPEVTSALAKLIRSVVSGLRADGHQTQYLN